MDPYPETCLRGIQKSEYITDEGRVTSAVFFPDERTAKIRNDGFIETSINWEDDTQVVVLTLSSFPNGIVRLKKSEIDRINSLPASVNELNYERTPEIGNPYHGNILFKNSISKPIRNMIAGALALACSKV